VFELVMAAVSSVLPHVPLKRADTGITPGSVGSFWSAQPAG
jgi:hypothetical protein